MGQANISMVQNMYAAFGRGDIATLLEGMALDIDWRVNGPRGVYPSIGRWQGRAQVKEFFRLVAETETFSDFSPRSFHASDDRVFVLGHYVFKLNKNGRTVASDWCHMFRIREGKVAEFCEFTDTAQVIDAYRAA
jgi:ketosteroid isomerase-like protein